MLRYAENSTRERRFSCTSKVVGSGMSDCGITTNEFYVNLNRSKRLYLRRSGTSLLLRCGSPWQQRFALMAGTLLEMFLLCCI